VIHGKAVDKGLPAQGGREARANTTEAEAILWRHLRQLELKGTHFRRQVVIGPYVADFACLGTRLIIEVDGSQHGTDEGIASDAVRTQWLEAEGYRVLRFWNNEVTTEIESVLEAIYQALTAEYDAHPTPPGFAGRPSPSRGG
jgi:very-short-patch-repair endonuclease